MIGERDLGWDCRRPDHLAAPAMLRAAFEAGDGSTGRASYRAFARTRRCGRFIPEAQQNGYRRARDVEPGITSKLR